MSASATDYSTRTWRASVQSSAISNAIVPSASQIYPDVITLVSIWSKLNSIRWQYPTQSPRDIERAREVGATLGRGMSFAVSRVRLEEDPRLSVIGGDAILKRINMVLNSRGEVDREARIGAAILEIRVLSHPPIRNHANIVDLLGLSWEKEPWEVAEKASIWPVILLPYSPFGNLEDFFRRHKTCQIETKWRVCKDIAFGIGHLHDCGVVHGDIKSENILLYWEDDRIVAKISDFGHSVLLSEVRASIQLPGGTPPWNAPEWRENIKRERLNLTDIYSFGLLVWRVILHEAVILDDDHFLFTSEPCIGLQGEENYLVVNELEHFKQTDDLRSFALEMCQQSPQGKEFATYLDGGLRGLETIFAKTLSSDPSARDLRSVMDTLTKSVIRTENPKQMPPDLGPEENTLQRAREAFLQLSERDTTQPGERDELASRFGLNQTLLGMVGFSPFGPSRTSDIQETSTLIASSWLRFHDRGLECIDRDEIDLDFEYLLHLRPEVKLGIFEGLVQVSEGEKYSESRRAQAKLHIFMCYFLACGTRYDKEQGLQALLAAARSGNIAAQALIKRVHETVGVQYMDELLIESWLIAGAETGSFIAAKDLKGLSQTKYEAAISVLKKRFCGVGHILFNHEEVLSTYAHNDSALLRSKICGPGGGHDLSLNSREDLLIHYAAMCGYPIIAEALLDEFPIYLEAVNSYNETPLFCACRSGNYEVYRLLMDRGAMADVYNILGETPLHWLIAFDDEHVETVARELVKNSPRLLKKVCKRNGTCYNHLWNGLIEGTALHRAVSRNHTIATRVLLELGADPLHGNGPVKQFWGFTPVRVSPLVLAVMSHNTEAVELMTQFLGEKVHELNPLSKEMRKRTSQKAITLDDIGTLLGQAGLFETLELHQTHSLLFFAVCPEPHLTRMVFHGPHLYGKMRDVVSMFRTPGVNEDSVTVSGKSVLFSAVERGEVDVVEFLISLEGLQRYVDYPAFPKGIRPIHVSIINDNEQVFSLLLRQNADILSPWKEDDGTWWTTLHACAMSDANGMFFATKLLELHPLEKFPKGSQPIFSTAVENRSFDLAVLLAEHGADQNQLSFPPGKKGRGFTTLGVSLTQNLGYCMRAVKFLLDPPNPLVSTSFIVEPKGRSNALHLVIHMNGDTDDQAFEELLNYLLQKFPKPDQINEGDEYGLTVLHFAVIVGNSLAVRLLLDAGADANCMTNFIGQPVGITPLDLARLYVSMEMLDVLQTRGDIDSTRWKHKGTDIVRLIEAAGGFAGKVARARASASWDWRKKIAGRMVEMDRRWFPIRRLSKWERSVRREQVARRRPGYRFASARGLDS